jgi:hypothetical protein
MFANSWEFVPALQQLMVNRIGYIVGKAIGGSDEKSRLNTIIDLDSLQKMNYKSLK